MRSVPGNILANFFGRGVVALLGLFCAPVYLHYLGTEGYGIVGIYVTLQSILGLLDMGMTAAITRGLAQGMAAHVDAARLRSLLRTLEGLYFVVGVLVGCVLFAAAPVIATHWVKPLHFTADEVARSVRLMGVAIACSWVAPLYSGALGGLQAQLELNVVLAAGALLRWGGAALVLIFGWATAGAFFSWQILAGTVQSLALFALVWKTMPASEYSARFDRRALEGIWRFAAGVSAISMLGILMAQLDKLMLSKLVSLSDFGQYTLASQFAMTLYFVAGPIFAAVFPHFSKLVVSGEQDLLRRHFHDTTQLVAVLVFPWGFTLALFAGPILTIWGHGVDVSLAMSLVPWLAAGTALNTLVNPPYALQLAAGRTRIVAAVHGVAVALLVPLLFALVAWKGAPGAAIAWLVLNVGYLLVGVPAMIRPIMPGQLARWYGVDIGIPAACALGVALLARALASFGVPLLTGVALVLSVTAGTALAAAAAPGTRPRLAGMLDWLRGGLR